MFSKFLLLVHKALNYQVPSSQKADVIDYPITYQVTTTYHRPQQSHSKLQPKVSSYLPHLCVFFLLSDFSYV